MAEPRTYRVLSGFCGIGGKTLGFIRARGRLHANEGRFVSVGGIDSDREACADFERLTKSPALCVDIARLTPAVLRAFAGDEAPDVVIGSPPCKGYSALLGKKRASEPKYKALNSLVLEWVRLLLQTWTPGPRLILIENVPRIMSRGADLLAEVRRRLDAAGYAVHESHHDCGELGGLAQHRRRYLLVARHRERCPALLYQPPKLRVRGVGEVLGELPMPGDPAGGPMHVMPRLSWLNWVRLALIPAGGDWRDLPGVLEEGQARREEFRRHQVQAWDAPASTVAGGGSNGPSAVADPRPFKGGYGVSPWDEPSGTVAGESYPSNGRGAVADPRPFNGTYGVGDWTEPAATLTGDARPSKGGFAVADPRVVPQAGNDGMHWGKYTVRDWDEPANTVTGAGRVGSGAQAVADPRAREWFHHAYKIVPWSAPAGTVTGHGSPSGAASVADPRVSSAYDKGYAVIPWTDPSPTVAGKSAVGCGAYAVADVRLSCSPRQGSYGVLSWEQAAGTVIGRSAIDHGRFCVADPRTGEIVAWIDGAKKSPRPGAPLIIARDGTWHRPLTTLELAALQSFPTVIDGEPLVLAGTSSSRWRERIGNAVPPDAAERIAEQMLVTLLAADGPGFHLSAADVWVAPQPIALEASP